MPVAVVPHALDVSQASHENDKHEKALQEFFHRDVVQCFHDPLWPVNPHGFNRSGSLAMLAAMRRASLTKKQSYTAKPSGYKFAPARAIGK
jgi:hypothetical protein